MAVFCAAKVMSFLNERDLGAPGKGEQTSLTKHSALNQNFGATGLPPPAPLPTQYEPTFGV